MWLNHAQRLHTFYVEQSMTNAAITLNEWVQQRFPVGENSYFNLMKLYDSVDNNMAVENQYNKLERIMYEQLDTNPSEQITIWYERWKRPTKS